MLLQLYYDVTFKCSFINAVLHFGELLRDLSILYIKGCLYFVFADTADSVYFGCVIRWHHWVPFRIWSLLQFWGSHLMLLQRLVLWIKGDLGQHRNLFNGAHIHGHVWDLTEQMVILAIRTLFVNSDCNHRPQQDFSRGSRHAAGGRRGACAAAPQGWRVWAFRAPSASVQVCGGGTPAMMRNRFPGYPGQIWNAVNRIPDSCSSQFFNKGNDPRCPVCSLNWSIPDSKTTVTPLQPRSSRRLWSVPPSSGWTPGLTKAARRIFSFLRNSI